MHSIRLALLAASSMVHGQILFADGFEQPSTDLPEIPASDQASSLRQQARPLGTTAAGQGFFEYLPAGYSDTQQYPLLIFVHGLGENGDGRGQLDLVAKNGPPRLIAQDQWSNALPFVVLSPQNSDGGCTRSSRIRDLITFAQANYAINSKRIYLTGLSCGAIGSWNYAANELNAQIAAMVPIAGDGRGAFVRAGCDLGTVPIWAFHGDGDNIVSPNGSIVPIEGLEACPTPPVDARLTLYPGVGHNSWRRTYDLSAGHDIYQWLLSYRRP